MPVYEPTRVLKYFNLGTTIYWTTRNPTNNPPIRCRIGLIPHRNAQQAPQEVSNTHKAKYEYAVYKK